MNAIHTYRSNRVESLLEAMAEVLAVPLASPLSAECVVVQSRGMAAWLSMRLAERFGAWANPDFPRPRQFVQRLLRATLGDEGDLVRRFSREHLTLVVHDLLDIHKDDPQFAPLAASLAQQAPGARLRLARNIADLFDQYGLYRPEMVLSWEDGDNDAPGLDPARDGWQPRLWRSVVERLGCDSPARLMRRAGQALEGGGISLAGLLPERVSLFGINTLPRLYLRLLARMAELVPVHLFLFAPSAEYFADIRSQAEIERELARAGVGLTEEDLFLESGHPLLASLGRVGRDFQLLFEEEATCIEAGEWFSGKERPASALELVQDDILHLRHRAPGSETPPWTLPNSDRSIAVHACHSRLREVEVLQDQLLGLLNDNGALAPRDILVMLPDVAAYAPLIDGVFGLPSEDPRFVPFRIADRPPMSQAMLIDVFDKVLELSKGRMPASGVMELLACQEIQTRFGLVEEELPTLRRWVEESGIRWGIDQQHRHHLAMPEDRHNTWRFGFDRLLLGATVHGNGRPVGGIYPWEGISGGGVLLAGRFIHFCETLFQYLNPLDCHRTLLEWRQHLTSLLQALFVQDSDRGWQLQLIRETLVHMEEEGAEAGFSGTLDLAGIQVLLAERLNSEARASGFLEGGITFCGMLPMRSIPFKVVCLLGMNDGEFPRLTHPQGIDLIARQPRPGDRSSRNDDRYLFLEALLAARERLLLFYVGASQRDGKAQPPSVVVEELLDCLADSLVMSGAADDPTYQVGALRDRLVVRHPLQPFSLRYFTGHDPRLFSFADHYFRAAQNKDAGLRIRHTLLPEPLSGHEGNSRDGEIVSIDTLYRFFRNPVQWFVENRLKVLLRQEQPDLADREVVTPDPLVLHQMASELLVAWRGDEHADEALSDRWRGEGRLPLGQAASAVLGSLREQVAPIRQMAALAAPGHLLSDRFVSIRLASGQQVEGTLRDRFITGRVHTTVSRLHGKVVLQAWLQHLLLCLAAPEDQSLYTTIIAKGEKGRAESLRLLPVADAAPLLEDLLVLLSAGSAEPLLFFPKSAYVLVEAVRQGKDLAKAMAAAKKEYKGSRFGVPGEGDGVYHRLIFGQDDPLAPGYAPYLREGFDHDFVGLSLRVLSPMFDHLEGAS